LAQKLLTNYEGKVLSVLKLTGHGKRAVELLERYVNDPDEYVNRRALITMASYNCPNTEYYCEKFWASEIHSGGKGYLQKVNILGCLKAIQSPKLAHYIELGKKAGVEFEVQSDGFQRYNNSDWTSFPLLRLHRETPK